MDAEMQGTPETASKSPEARRVPWNRFSLRRIQSCQHLDLGLLAFRTEREWISVVEPAQFVVPRHGGPKKLTQIVTVKKALS